MGRPSSLPRQRLCHKKNSTATRKMSQSSACCPGCHAPWSPATTTSTEHGGGCCPVTACHRPPAHPSTCRATGQPMKIWVRVSGTPAAAHTSWWHAAEAACGTDPASDKGRGREAAHAAHGSAACKMRHTRNLWARGAGTRRRRAHTRAQGRPAAPAMPPLGSSKCIAHGAAGRRRSGPWCCRSCCRSSSRRAARAA